MSSNVDSMLEENLVIEHTENEFQESVYCDDDNNPTPDEANTYVEVTNISPHYFDFLKLIGEGAFGKVFLVKNKLNDKLFAMKVISKKVLKKKNNISYMKSERDILLKMNHPFIVSLWHAFQTEKKLFLVMDFLAGGEFFFHLRRRGLILEKEIKFYLGEMVLALEFLHNLNIIHRDLKPENILLRADGHVCLTDFGLAKDFGSQEKARTFCGTSEYMAPEMLTRNGYSTSVDWWALGTLCFEMLTGKPPFTAKAEKDLFKKIVSEKLICPSYLSATTHSLLKGLLEKDVNKRLGCMKSNMFSIGGVTALKQHDFFGGLDWIALFKCEIKPPIDLGLQSISRSLTQSPDTNHDDNSNSNNNNDSSVMINGSSNNVNGTYNAVGNSNTNNANNNNGNNIKHGQLTENDFLTMHFHEGFTTQAINLSILEDTNSIMSSSSYPNTDDGNNSIANNNEEFELYSGFDYTGTPLKCTQNKMKQVLDEIANTTAKMTKKLKLKAKKGEEKIADNEAKIRLKLQQEHQKREAEIALQLQKEQQLALAVMKKMEQQKLHQIQQYEVQVKQYHEQRIQYDLKLESFQKKIKILKKKLRDINELEKKVQDTNNTSNNNNSNNNNNSSSHKSTNNNNTTNNITLTKEQKEKLQSKADVLFKLQEIEDEENEYIDITPEPVPPLPLSDELLTFQQQISQPQQTSSSPATVSSLLTVTTIESSLSTNETTNNKSDAKNDMPSDLHKMNITPTTAVAASSSGASKINTSTAAIWSTPGKPVVATTSNVAEMKTSSATSTTVATTTSSTSKIVTPTQSLPPKNSQQQSNKKNQGNDDDDDEWATVPVKSASSSSAKKKGGVVAK